MTSAELEVAVRRHREHIKHVLMEARNLRTKVTKKPLDQISGYKADPSPDSRLGD